MPHLAAVDRYDWTIAKSASRAGCARSAGGALLGLDRADVAFRLIRSESDGQVGGEAEDLLVVAEPAGKAQPVFADLGALFLVIGDALGDGAAVPGADVREVSGAATSRGARATGR